MGRVFMDAMDDPFAAVDPLVRRLWLAEVAESLPLTTLFSRDPAGTIASALPVGLGCLACFAATLALRAWADGLGGEPTRRAGPQLQRTRFAFVAILVGAGLALSFWQVRVLSSVGAIAVLGGVYAVTAAKGFWQAQGRPVLASLSLVLLLPFTAPAATLVASAWARPASVPPASALPNGAARPDTGKERPAEDDCLAPADFAPLAAVSGTVDAPVDAGAFLLVHTGLDPYAAAFHRDNDGNRFHFDLAMAEPARAERIARSRRLDYIMVCTGWAETGQLARRSADSFAAGLLADGVPSWLEPVAVPGTPIKVFRLRAPAQR